MPSLVTCFWLSFATTLLLVLGAIATGLARRRRAHVTFAVIAVAVLTVTIVLAEKLGKARSFPPDAMRIHLWFAQSAALMVLPVGVSGVLLFRQARWRRLHRIAVVLFLLLTVAATATGVWVFGLSTPK